MKSFLGRNRESCCFGITPSQTVTRWAPSLVWAAPNLVWLTAGSGFWPSWEQREPASGPNSGLYCLVAGELKLHGMTCGGCGELASKPASQLTALICPGKYSRPAAIGRPLLPRSYVGSADWWQNQGGIFWCKYRAQTKRLLNFPFVQPHPVGLVHGCVFSALWEGACVVVTERVVSCSLC